MRSSLEEKRVASSEVGMRRLRVPTSWELLELGPSIKLSFYINTSITQFAGECGAGHPGQQDTRNSSAERDNRILRNLPQILALGPK